MENINIVSSFSFFHTDSTADQEASDEMSTDEPFDPFGLEEHATGTTDSLFDDFAEDIDGNGVTNAAAVQPIASVPPSPPRRPKSEGLTSQLSTAPPVEPIAMEHHHPHLLVAPVVGIAPPSAMNRSSTRSNHSRGLPPKITVKLTIHEEATATALPHGNAGSSHVSVAGRIEAQIQCSDAMKNCPFRLEPADPLDIFNVNPLFISGANHEVRVPKHEIGKLHLADYAVSRQVRHMPLLLERKISSSGLQCRVAVQIRTKLTNHGDLHDLAIVVAVPEVVDGASIDIVRGDGVYDELKRTLHWKLDELKKGASVLVAAQAQLWEPTDILQFPVMIRCLSEADPISGVEFKILPADGHPSSVTSNSSCSFRLLHRLP